MNKSLLSFLLLLTAVAVFGSDFKFSREAQSPRKIEIGNQTELWFSNGKADFEIVAGPTKVARFAANELAFQLSRVLGTKLKVAAAKSGKLPALIVGDPEIARQNGLFPEKLDRDGYFIRTLGKDILLVGTDHPAADPERHGYFERGTLFAVYEFLERFAGVRYYFPGEIGTVAPRLTEWHLPKIDITDRPDSQFRQVYSVFLGPEERRKGYLYSNYDPQKHYRDREYQLRLLTRSIHNTHGLAYLGLIQRFAKSHPEYFALAKNGSRYDGQSVIRCHADRTGQICFSNPELKKVIIEDGIALLSGKPASSRNAVSADGTPYLTMRPEQRPFFCIMPNDSMAPCYCPGCISSFSGYAQRKPGKECNEFVWNWMIDVAEAIRKAGAPGYVTTMAYTPYREIPERKIPDNMIIRLALSGAWASPEESRSEIQLLKNWTEKIGNKIYLWNYMINTQTYGMTDIPHMTPEATGEFYHRAYPYSFGAFLECENEYYLGGYLNYYVFSKLMWDKNTDVEKLLREHDTLMFGSAAAVMRDIRGIWEHHWLKDIAGHTVETPAGPAIVKPTLTELWEKIYSPAELKRINELFDKAEQMTRKEPDARERIQFIRANIWQRTINAAQDYKQQFDDRESWFTVMPEKEGGITIDGKLDEPAWEKAPAVWMLPRKHDQNKSDQVEVQTKVYLLRDSEYFYFGFNCEEPHTDKMVKLQRTFDDKNLWMDNLVEIFLAPGRRSRKMYQFMISSSGSTADLRSFGDWQWNSGMTAKVSVDPGKSWSAEVRIPRESMPELEGPRIAANFTRGRKLEDQTNPVLVPYYTWSAFGEQTPENCGNVLFDSPVPASIVRDGGFAQPMRWINGKYPSPWYGPHGVKVNFNTTDFRTNGASAIMDRNCTELFQYLSQIKASTKYKLSFYLKLKDVRKLKPQGGFNMRIGFYVHNGRSIYPFTAMYGNQPWRRYVFEIKTPENIGDAKKAAICFYFRDASGEALLDQVELTEIK